MYEKKILRRISIVSLFFCVGVSVCHTQPFFVLSRNTRRSIRDIPKNGFSKWL